MDAIASAEGAAGEAILDMLKKVEELMEVQVNYYLNQNGYGSYSLYFK
jgi:molybdenum cofactor biosynthesis enzyme